MASAHASNAPEDGFPTYGEYVEALAKVDPQFSWLARFFSHRPQSPASTTEISIVDSEEGILKNQHFSLNELGQSPPSGSTRLVILSYDEA